MIALSGKLPMDKRYEVQFGDYTVRPEACKLGLSGLKIVAYYCACIICPPPWNMSYLIE
jgi:hypothetical protein